MRMELAEWQSCGQVQSLEIVSKKWELANQEEREGFPAKEGVLTFEVILIYVVM